MVIFLQLDNPELFPDSFKNIRGVGAALNVWGGGHLGPAAGGRQYRGLRRHTPRENLKLESLKCHFLHFRRRFMEF
jgi:hypothetical protein